MDPQYKGDIDETLSPEKEAKLFKHEEIAFGFGPALDLPVASLDTIPFYENRDQNGSSTCMNQAYAKHSGIDIKKKTGRYVSLSGGYLYPHRSNKPGDGMGIYNLFDLGAKMGLPFEVVHPSQNMTDKQVENAQPLPYTDEVALLFADPNKRYFHVDPDFDTALSIIKSGYSLVITQFADREEYNIVPEIKKPNLTPGQAGINHGVCIHTGVLYNGNPVIVMDESWGIFKAKADDDLQKALQNRGQRMLTREWFNKRVKRMAYKKDVRYGYEQNSLPLPVRPWHKFDRDLEWGMMGDADVKAWQDILKYEGFFPIDEPSTGNFKGLTQKGTEDFQKKYNIVSFGTPSTTGFGRVGPETRKIINKIYS
jgi:hypothetical protein